MPSDMQLHTLRLYGELLSRAPDYGGKLVLTGGEGSSATGLPAAVSIAGGAMLVIDPDAIVVKSVFRQGGVDFVVNTLDEALRILKNELRKQTAVSVALIAPVTTVVEEMNERGVQADLHVGFRAGSWVETVEEGGPHAIQRLQLDEEGSLVQPSAFASEWLARQGWSERSLTPASVAGLRELDSRLLSLESLGTLRANWIRRISKYQRPAVDAGRAVWLSASEGLRLSLPPSPA